MRNIITVLLFLASFQVFGQATMVVRNPSWLIADETKEALEKADRLRQLNILTEQVNTQRENLQAIKDATEKLRKINRKVANYHNLELAIV
jgi:ABC-type dipeptide/oligopeptide/nickel transport system ATPase component